MVIKLSAPPAIEPITLTEAKAHLRVDFSDDDDLISGLIKTAREYAEGYQNRALCTQTWELWLDSWPSESYIKIPLPPLQSITSIKYYDSTNTEATMADTDYQVDVKSEPGRVALAYSESWPAATLRPINGICITFNAGYGNAGDVPQRMKQAMLLLVGHWYEHREATLTGPAAAEIEFGVNSLLGLDKVDVL
jgi:phage conserved hypothetical protein, phiE125 gp8 family